MTVIPAGFLTTEYVLQANHDILISYLRFVNTDENSFQGIKVDVTDGYNNPFVLDFWVTNRQSREVPLPVGGVCFAGGLKWRASMAGVVSISTSDP